MTHSLCNYTAYIASGDTEKIINSIVTLCEKEGMRRVDAPQGTLHHAPALECNNWGINVISGIAGWHVLSTEPWDLLSDRASGSARSRLFALCEALRAAGFALHIADGGPWGQILLEADGHGRQHVSGYWSKEGDEADTDYFGIPLRTASSGTDSEDRGEEEIRFALLDSLQSMLEDGRDDAKCGIYADHKTEQACEHIARQLGCAGGTGGQVGEYDEEHWWQWRASPETSTVLHFTWQERDRPEPQPTAHELASEEFNSVPRHFYADGTAIMTGDALLFDGGRFPGLVTGLLANWDGNGKFYASGVRVNQGESFDRARGENSPESSGHFVDLHLVERTTKDFMQAGVQWLTQKAAGGDAAAQCNLGNLYVNGIGVAQDHVQGGLWWRKAAEQGNALALYHLGSMYFNGQGVAADKKLAAQWWSNAAALGHEDAKKRLAAMIDLDEGR